MSSLSGKGRDLIKAGRSALRATPADRERIAAALRDKLGAEALPIASASKWASLRARWSFAHSAGVAGLLLGGILLATIGSQVKTPPAPTSVEPQPSYPAQVPLPPAEVSDAPHPEASAAPEPSSRAPRRQTESASAQRPDRLAQEVALMSRATSALSAGRPRNALRLLTAHEQRFAKGVLEEERRAAKARALCLLGHLSEARAELEQLAPGSPSARRAREVCDTASQQRDMK